MDEHTDAEAPDDVLVARLKIAAQRFDPVPPAVLAGGLAAFTWRDLDIELELLTLEHADDDDKAGVRSSGTAVGRFFTLGCDSLVVELEMFPAADGVLALQGLVLLAPIARVEVRTSSDSGPKVTDVERGGRFAFSDIEHGPVKLVFHDDDGPRFASEWLTF
jgi:hypothetical protein